MYVIYMYFTTNIYYIITSLGFSETLLLVIIQRVRALEAIQLSFHRQKPFSYHCWVFFNLFWTVLFTDSLPKNRKCQNILNSEPKLSTQIPAL